MYIEVQRISGRKIAVFHPDLPFKESGAKPWIRPTLDPSKIGRCVCEVIAYSPILTSDGSKT